MDVGQVIDLLLEKIKGITKSETVIGSPMPVGENFVVPISRVRIGFIAGTGERKRDEAKGEGGISGGGISVEPIGLLVITSDGKTYFHSISKGIPTVIERLVEVVPEIADKFIKKIKEGEEVEGEKLKEEKLEREKLKEEKKKLGESKKLD